jgi:hypothetical protein
LKMAAAGDDFDDELEVGTFKSRFIGREALERETSRRIGRLVRTGFPLTRAATLEMNPVAALKQFSKSRRGDESISEVRGLIREINRGIPEGVAGEDQRCLAYLPSLFEAVRVDNELISIDLISEIFGKRTFCAVPARFMGRVMDPVDYIIYMGNLRVCQHLISLMVDRRGLEVLNPKYVGIAVQTDNLPLLRYFAEEIIEDQLIGEERVDMPLFEAFAQNTDDPISGLFGDVGDLFVDGGVNQTCWPQALMLACKLGKLNIVKYLVENGERLMIDINWGFDGNGACSAIIFASLGGAGAEYWDIIDYLRQHGARDVE